jgi:hypothetical protein
MSQVVPVAMSPVAEDSLPVAWPTVGEAAAAVEAVAIRPLAVAPAPTSRRSSGLA